MSDNLVKQSNGLQKTATPYSSDSVLSEMLMVTAQVMGREILPGEVRLWSETFKSVNPKTLEMAFRNYLATCKFFPKPGDIWECIEQVREAIRAQKEEMDLTYQEKSHGEAVPPEEVNVILHGWAEKMKLDPPALKIASEPVRKYYQPAADDDVERKRQLLLEQRKVLGVEAKEEDSIPPELRVNRGTSERKETATE